MYAVFSSRGELDQLVETVALAKREVADLKRMGFDQAFFRLAKPEEEE